MLVTNRSFTPESPLLHFANSPKMYWQGAARRMNLSGRPNFLMLQTSDFRQ